MSIGGLLVISFGAPHKSEDIRPFLRDVLAERPVPEERFESVAHHYELLGGRSPITEHTERQAAALALELAQRGLRLPVRAGMRRWTPWLREALSAFKNVEVLFDLDIEAKQKADELGVQLQRASTVSAHPAFIAELASAVQRLYDVHSATSSLEA